jgi:probable F420-dependent oxidoreductase
VAIAFPRSPMVTAQIAWDLAAQSEGRFILGLGTQIKAHITRRFSVDWSAPVPRLREYIQSMRAIWDTFQTGAPLRYRGEHYRFGLMTPFFSPGPIATPDVPVYIAGVNEGLCRLAGEMCQGFHVHPFHTVRYLEQLILPNIRAGAEKSGRSAGDVSLSCAVFVVTGRDRADMQANSQSVRSQLAFYASTPSYSTVMEMHGWRDLHERLNTLSHEGKWAEMGALVSDEMLNAFAVVAPYDELAGAVKARYEGLLHRVGYYFPFDPSDEGRRILWEDAGPHLWIVMVCRGRGLLTTIGAV